MSPTPVPSLHVLALVQHASRMLIVDRRRSVVTAMGIALALFLMASVSFLRSSLSARAERLRKHAGDLTVQQLVSGRPTPIALSVVTSIQDLTGVRSATPRVWGFLFAPALQANVVVVGTPLHAPRLQDVEGRDLQGTHEMVVGDALAKALGLRVGDTLALPPLGGRPIPLKVVGILAEASDAFAADALFTSEEDARNLLAMNANMASDIVVYAHNPAELSVLAGAIADLTPGLRTVSRDGAARIQEATYGRRSGLFLAATLPALLILVLLFADRINMGSSRERRLLAIQKAVGWSTTEVVYAKVAESVLLASFGTLLGLLFAYLYVFTLQAPGLRSAIAGVSALAPGMHLTLHVGIAELLGLLALGLVPLVAASLIPSWRVAMADPVAVLRGE